MPTITCSVCDGKGGRELPVVGGPFAGEYDGYEPCHACQDRSMPRVSTSSVQDDPWLHEPVVADCGHGCEVVSVGCECEQVRECVAREDYVYGRFCEDHFEGEVEARIDRRRERAYFEACQR